MVLLTHIILQTHVANSFSFHLSSPWWMFYWFLEATVTCGSFSKSYAWNNKNRKSLVHSSIYKSSRPFIFSIPCDRPTLWETLVLIAFSFQVSVRVYRLVHSCPSWHHRNPPVSNTGPLVWKTHALPIVPRPLPNLFLNIYLIILLYIKYTTAILTLHIHCYKRLSVLQNDGWWKIIGENKKCWVGYTTSLNDKKCSKIQWCFVTFFFKSKWVLAFSVFLF